MGKDRRIFNLANNNGSAALPGRILTPFHEEDMAVFVLKNSLGQDTYVQEVPRCRFMGVPICLACQTKLNVPKVNMLTRKFAEMWKELIDRGIIQTM